MRPLRRQQTPTPFARKWNRERRIKFKGPDELIKKVIVSRRDLELFENTSGFFKSHSKAGYRIVEITRTDLEYGSVIEFKLRLRRNQ